MTFVAFSLPRSRSAWLSVFLSAGGRQVHHDLAIGCATPEAFAHRIGDGACETGAGFAWPVIRDLLPDAKFLVVRRHPLEVAERLLALTGIDYTAEMRRRAAHLKDISDLPWTLTVDYEALGDGDTCRRIFEHCVRERMPEGWWERLAGLNIQVDMGARMKALAAAAPRVEALKREVRRRIGHDAYEIGPEPWSASWWTDAQPLADRHYEEVDGGVEARRLFDLDTDQMAAAYNAGAMELITVRQDGDMVGYFTWNLMFDVESRGLLIATQGAWYLADGHQRAFLRMWRASIARLQERGVQCVYPHHRMQGRGARLGHFFRRQGAKKTQDTYSLWIGA